MVAKKKWVFIALMPLNDIHFDHAPKVRRRITTASQSRSHDQTQAVEGTTRNSTDFLKCSVSTVRLRNNNDPFDPNASSNILIIENCGRTGKPYTISVYPTEVPSLGLPAMEHPVQFVQIVTDHEISGARELQAEWRRIVQQRRIPSTVSNIKQVSASIFKHDWNLDL
jgi:hypothetical protein